MHLTDSVHHTLNCRGRLLDLDQPVVMGILNNTSDSFYTSSRLSSIEDIITRAHQHIFQGAQILDVGAMSTRPGADEIDEIEEGKRIKSVIEALISTFPDVILSVDTYRASVAEVALEAGAHIINDISGGQFDSRMLEVVGQYGAPYILMHNRAKSKVMQSHVAYDDLLQTMTRYFYERLHIAHTAGITDVIIDPGIGFSKTITHNFQLIERLDELLIVKAPLLIGLSRKSFIYKTLELTAAEALNGTTALHMLALDKGASILRVHDVAEAVECVKLQQGLRRANSKASG